MLTVRPDGNAGANSTVSRPELIPSPELFGDFKGGQLDVRDTSIDPNTSLQEQCTCRQQPPCAGEEQGERVSVGLAREVGHSTLVLQDLALLFSPYDLERASWFP